jgi:hypothetical protein
LKDADFEQKRSAIEKTLKAMYLQADHLWEDPERYNRLVYEAGSNPKKRLRG